MFPPVKGVLSSKNPANSTFDVDRVNNYAKLYVIDKVLNKKDAEKLAMSVEGCSKREFEDIGSKMQDNQLPEVVPNNKMALWTKKQRTVNINPANQIKKLVEKATVSSTTILPANGEKQESQFELFKRMKALKEQNPELHILIPMTSRRDFYRYTQHSKALGDNVLASSIPEDSSSSSSTMPTKSTGGRPTLLDDVAKHQMYQQINYLSDEGCGFLGRMILKALFSVLLRKPCEETLTPKKLLEQI
jgi:hypothetical protein